jgi:ubiquinone/menaquinone biosynthesis C-methylase UbiE
MSIEQIYNKAVKHYGQDISAEVLKKANMQAFDFICQHDSEIKSILALGVGDGAFLLPYKKVYPEASLSGLDISKKMLVNAKEKLECKTHHGSIDAASQIIQGEQFDLILAHFVCAYVKPEVILQQCHKLLNKNGYVSLVSNTSASFPKLMAAFKALVASKRLWATILDRHVSRALETVFVPKSLDAFVLQVKQAGLQVLQQESLSLQVSFLDSNSFCDFFMDAGWFANGLLHPLMPVGTIKCIFKQLVNKHLSFPFQDKLDVSVITAKRS